MKNKPLIRFSIFFVFVLATINYTYAQGNAADSVLSKRIEGYQIHLKQPAKELRLLMYEKNFMPVKGRLSDDKKAIIMDNYEHGNKVRVKVIYEDGTSEEFVRSPCYIDPIIKIL